MVIVWAEYFLTKEWMKWSWVFLALVHERPVQRGGLRVSGNVREDDRRRSNGGSSGWLERQKGGDGKRWGRFQQQHADTATKRMMGVFQVRWRLEREQREKERLRKIEENKRVNTHNHTHTHLDTLSALLFSPANISFSSRMEEARWNNGFRGHKSEQKKKCDENKAVIYIHRKSCLPRPHLCSNPIGSQTLANSWFPPLVLIIKSCDWHSG